MATKSRKRRRKHRSKFRNQKRRRTIFGLRGERVASFATMFLCLCGFIAFFPWGSGGCGGGSGPNASVTPTPQEDVVYYLDDHLGNTHLMTDSLGNVVKEVKHYPYGVKVEENEGSDDVVVDYTYTGKEYDKETGLVYFGGRYYSPEMGRWISPDPLYVGNPQTAVVNPLSSNLYGYVRNNPLSMIDTFGLIENWAPYAYPGVNQTRAAEPYEREAVMSVVRPAANAFTTIMPGVSDLRDAYELLMGHDLHTGQALSMPQRALSGLGLVIGSGAAYREFGNVSGAIGPGREGTTVYRVWGDEAGAWGRSWTDVDPRTVSDYRNVAGLPNQNSGRFVSEGVLQNTRGITLKPADPLHGNTGGLSEIVIPNPQKQIKLQNVQGVNPEL